MPALSFSQERGLSLLPMVEEVVVLGEEGEGQEQGVEVVVEAVVT